MDRKHLLFATCGAAALLACSAKTPSAFSKTPAQSPASEVAPKLTTAANERTLAMDIQELTLPEALGLTLEGSPELKAFSLSLRTSEARILQAGLIPNPEISLAVEDIFGPYQGKDYSQATFLLSQVIELGGKRAARINAADAARDQSVQEYEVKRIEVLSSLTEKFIRTVADENLLRLARKGEELARQGLQNIRKRSAAGGASELEEAKARVLLARARIETEHAEHELLSSKRAVAAFWGADTTSFSTISADLYHALPLPGLPELEARIEHSPEIRKWATEKRIREAERKLAFSKSIPNLTIGAGPRRIETMNGQSFVFQVSIPLNIFDRNQAAIQEAAILDEKVSFDESAARVRLKSALFGLYQEVSHAKTQLEAMKREIIPQAERSLRVAQSGYEQGRFSYLDLLDAQRTLLEVSRERIEAAYSFHSFTNAIERLLGTPLNTGQEMKAQG